MSALVDRGNPPFATWGPPPRRRRGGGCLGLLLTVVAGIAFLGFALSAVGSLALATPGLAPGPPAPPQLPRNVGPAPPSAPAGSAEAALQANPLYRVGLLPTVSCPAPPLGSAGTEEQTVFYEQLLGCLNQAWSPALERAGFRNAEPGLVVFDADISTPCGTFAPQTGRVLAFYCLADEVMYADAAQMAESFGDHDVAYAIVIGHEYGHHVQQMSGMTQAEYAVVQRAPDRRLDISRRRELQASCFGGLFLGAVAESYPIDAERRQELDAISRVFGDPEGAPASRRDHGSGASNSYWILKAFAGRRLGLCDTFTARSGLVR